MRLSEADKTLVLSKCPRSAQLVRVGEWWAVIERVANVHPSVRWSGRIVRQVEQRVNIDDLSVERVIWWTGWVDARTRREVVQLLTAEANR